MRKNSQDTRGQVPVLDPERAPRMRDESKGGEKIFVSNLIPAYDGAPLSTLLQ